MIKVIFAAAFSLVFFTSIYTLQVPANGGGTIDFGAFTGKKVLVVNIATGSPLTPQLGALEQLYQKYKDSLVIIAFPSNSFNNETRDDAAIGSFCTSTYNIHFKLAAKAEVIGASAVSVFSWLQSEAQNGVTTNAVNSDFQNFLIDKDGAFIGAFSSRVDPMSDELQNANIGQ